MVGRVAVSAVGGIEADEGRAGGRTELAVRVAADRIAQPAAGGVSAGYLEAASDPAFSVGPQGLTVADTFTP